MDETDYKELYDLVSLKAEDLHPYEVMVGERIDAEEERSRKARVLEEIIPCLATSLGCEWVHKRYQQDRFSWWLLTPKYCDDSPSDRCESDIAIVLSPDVNIAAFKVQGSQLTPERVVEIKGELFNCLRLSRILTPIDYDRIKLTESPEILRGLLVWATSGNDLSVDFEMARERIHHIVMPFIETTLGHALEFSDSIQDMSTWAVLYDPRFAGDHKIEGEANISIDFSIYANLAAVSIQSLEESSLRGRKIREKLFNCLAIAGFNPVDKATIVSMPYDGPGLPSAYGCESWYDELFGYT